MSDVTIIIPNYNGAGVLSACLEACLHQTYLCDIIVVDDGSTDDSLKLLRAFAGRLQGIAGQPKLTVIRHAENRGFAAAVNTGIRAAKTAYVLLLNNDTVADKDMAARLVHAIGKKKNTFAVQALLLRQDKESDGGKESLIDDAGDCYCALGWAFSPLRDHPRSACKGRRRVMSVCAGAALYRRDMLTALGLFDEAHCCYLEDVDISLRAHRKGYLSFVIPEALVYHHASLSSGSRYNAFKTRLTTANSLYLVRKHMRPWMIVLNLPLLAAGFLIKGVFYARRGCGKAFLQGLAEGAKKIAGYGRVKEKYEIKTTLSRNIVFQLELLGNVFRRLVA